MFKVGDLIKCKEGFDCYLFTNAGVVCKVTKFTQVKNLLGEYKVMYIKAERIIDTTYYYKKTGHRSFCLWSQTAEYAISEDDFHRFELYEGHTIGSWD